MMNQNFLKRSLILVVIAILLAFVVFGCSPQAADQAEDEVQDETQDAVGQDQNEERIAELEKKLKLLTQDNSEGGCSGGGCHEGEYSLQNEVENLEDHPSVESDSLAECMKCHASGEYAFKTLIHKVHLVEGEHYTDEYDKNCINCHEISEEGKVSVEGLEEENGANGEEVGNNEEDETNGETENGNNEE